VWVTLGFQHAIALVDPETNEIARRIEVGGDPYGIAFDGSNLWIANFQVNEVVRVDPESGDIVARFDVAGPTEIAVGENAIWVSEHFEGRAARIDPLTNEVVNQLTVGGRPGVFVALGSLWARSNDRRTVTRIDPDTEETLAIIEVPSNPYDIDLADGSIWVTVSPQRGACERNSHLVRIDPSTNVVDGAIAVPCAFSIVSDGERLWATGGGSMVRIDP
jgi:DNA-binding beta-propeller fold protein YncE